MTSWMFWKKEQPTPQIQTGPHLTVKQRIHNGAVLLDAACPGWSRRINPETLDIRGGGSCVLGQLYGCFGDGVNELHLTTKPNEPLNPTNLGFDTRSKIHTYDQAADWRELNEGWRKFLAEREHEQAYQAKDA